MDARKATHHSKFLSLVLRHKPQEIGITLDAAGWVNVEVLLEAMELHGQSLSLEELREIVSSSDKQRFAFSDDAQQIRSNQGHSVAVELGYEPAEPPATLYHGTGEKYLPSIRVGGLVKGKRHHVHLSDAEESAAAVGRRHGKLAMLLVRTTGDMHRDGHAFFRTPNGVWLTDSVPVQYLNFAEDK